jgi:hypothetical protein
VGSAGGEVVPGGPAGGYAGDPAFGAGTADSVVITKDGRTVGTAAAPRVSRTPAFEARVSARLDSIERAVAARDAAAGRAAGAGATAADVRAIVREEIARDETAREERARAAAVLAAPDVTVRTREVTRTVGGGPYDPRRDPRGVQGGMLYSGATVNDGGQLLAGGASTSA